MSLFKKKATLDGYSEDTTWHMVKKSVKCPECGKKTNVLYIMAAGNMLERCKECTDIAEDKLIAQCPTCYLESFEEYKEWKSKRK